MTTAQLLYVKDSRAPAPIQDEVRAVIRRSFAALLITVMVAGCGSANTALSPTPAVDLSGTWSGAVGAGSGGGTALRITWMANEAGATVSGTATLSTSPAVTDIKFVGSLTGTLTGSHISLMYAAAAEGVPATSGCSVAGGGSAVVSDATMSGNLSVTFSSCDALGLRPPAGNQFTLTKQ
jgi:hypothetical protein